MAAFRHHSLFVYLSDISRRFAPECLTFEPLNIVFRGILFYAGRYEIRCMTFTLFHFEGCHLCEQAEVLLQSLGVEYARIDIGDDTELDVRYGERVPVLRENPSGRELGWPFDPTTLRWFVQGP